MKVTIACPAALIPQANHLAMCLGESLADGQTFRAPTWQDVAGGLYAAASWDAGAEWLVALQEPLVRPEWDADEEIDLSAAGQAQGATVVWGTDMETATPQAGNTVVPVIYGIDGYEALTLMGLTQISDTQ